MNPDIVKIIQNIGKNVDTLTKDQHTSAHLTGPVSLTNAYKGVANSVASKIQNISSPTTAKTTAAETSAKTKAEPNLEIPLAQKVAETQHKVSENLNRAASKPSSENIAGNNLKGLGQNKKQELKNDFAKFHHDYNDIRQPDFRKTPFQEHNEMTRMKSQLAKHTDVAREAGANKSADKTDKAVDLAMTATRAAAGDPIAIAKLAKEAAEEAKKRIAAVGESGKEAFKAVTSDRAGESVAHAGGSVEQLGKASGSGTLETVGKFGRKIGEATEKLRTWVDKLHEGNMRFAEFSASMSVVQAQSDYRRMILEREQGEKLAPSAQGLAEAKDRMNREFAAFETPIKTLGNKIGEWAADLTGTSLKKIKEVLGLPDVGGGEEKEYLNKYLGDLGEPWAASYGRPGQLNPQKFK